MNRHLCPVCGYRLQFPPSDYNICSCCGTEFGYDDGCLSHEELRAEWLRAGVAWWSPVESAPEGWDPYTQVSNLLSGGLLSKLFSPVLGATDQGLSASLLKLISGHPPATLTASLSVAPGSQDSSAVGLCGLGAYLSRATSNSVHSGLYQAVGR